MAKKKTVPEGWADLNEKELRTAAAFFGTDDEAPTKVLVPDLLEAGVDWDMYKNAFLKEEPEDALKTEVVIEDNLKLHGTENVIKSEDVAPVKGVKKVTEEVKTADPNLVLASANYLVKMERSNPYFEFACSSGKKYEFTQENPYNIMPAQDAQEVLSGEVGFRQAFPAELEEYYS